MLIGVRGMAFNGLATWLRNVLPTRRKLAVGLVVAAALTPVAMLMQRVLPAEAFLLEEQLHDWHQRVTTLRMPTAHPLVALVLVDDELVRLTQDQGEADRAVLAKLISIMDAMGVRMLGFDMTFVTPSNPAADAALIAAMREARSATVMGFADERARLDARETDFQAALLARFARPVGFTHIRVDGDGVVRYWASPAADTAVRESFAAQLMRSAGSALRAPPYPRIDWLGSPVGGGGAPFVTIPASQLRQALAEDRRQLAAMVKDRMVIVGLATAETRRFKTPLTGRDGERFTSAEVHAHVVAQLLDGRAFSLPSPVQLAGWFFSRILFGFLVGCRRRHVRSDAVSAAAGASGLFLLDAYTFGASRTVVPVTLLAAAWIAGIAAGHLAWRIGGGRRDLAEAEERAHMQGIMSTKDPGR